MLQTTFGQAAAGGFATIPTSSYSYKPVGVNLAITPRVTYEGEIVLDLSVENNAHRRAGRRRRAVGALVHVAQGAHLSCGCAKGKPTCSPGLIKQDKHEVAHRRAGALPYSGARAPCSRATRSPTTTTTS